MRVRLRRKYRGPLAAVVILGLFAAALIAWVGRDSSAGNKAAGLRPGVSAPSLPSLPTSLATGSAPAPGSPGGSGAPSGSPELSLPSTSINADGAEPPKHTITMVITSDDVLTGFGYVVSTGLGKPSKHGEYHVKSPITVHTTGRSYGVVAEVIAQAGAHAGYVTCKLTVDGKLRADQTVHGAYKFAVCSG